MNYWLYQEALKKMKDFKRVVVFEYNDSEDNFNANYGTSEENTHGYRTICETTYGIWNPFYRMLIRRYDFETDNRPSFDSIQKEWEDYLLLLKDIDYYKAEEERIKEDMKKATNG